MPAMAETFTIIPADIPLPGWLTVLKDGVPVWHAAGREGRTLRARSGIPGKPEGNKGAQPATDLMASGRPA
jgi:hypothetical protein